MNAPNPVVIAIRYASEEYGCRFEVSSDARWPVTASNGQRTLFGWGNTFDEASRNLTENPNRLWQQTKEPQPPQPQPMPAPRGRGSVVLIVVAALALLGGGLWFAKPEWLPGQSKRAAESKKSTENLVRATEAPATAVAASVVSIERANAEAPPSPSRAFIASEVPLMLARLPPPDQNALIAAEKRRTAYAEGKLEEANKLLEAESKKTAILMRDKEHALQRRREADDALVEAAAAAHAKHLQLFGLGLIALLAVAAWLWARLNSISLPSAGKILASVRSGEEDVVQAFDRVLPHRLHAVVQKHVRLNSTPPEPPTPTPRSRESSV